jgi:hypothetical protein
MPHSGPSRTVIHLNNEPTMADSQPCRSTPRVSRFFLSQTLGNVMSTSAISIACFETTSHGQLEGVKRDLFDLIVEFEDVEEGERTVRKRMSTWKGDERTNVEYIEM